MSLKGELDKRRRAVAERLPAVDRRTIDESIERLRMLQLAENALKVGASLPDFALPDQDEQIVRSDLLLHEGPLILVFFRGGWCPYCDIAMRAMEAEKPKIEALGATLLGILPEKPAQLRHTTAECGISYRLYATSTVPTASSAASLSH